MGSSTGIVYKEESSMRLAQFLESRFRGDIRFRGEQYIKKEQVFIMDISPDDLHGEVRDGLGYRTHLHREENDLRMSCTCRPESLHDVACKHVWGTILAIDAAGILPSSIMPGYLPPFMVESNPLDPTDDDWDEEFDDEFPRPGATPGPRSGARLATAPKKEWDDQLSKLRESLSSREAARSAGDKDREIYYEIDLPASREQGMLVLLTSQRQKRGSGQWGKLKPLRLRPALLEEVEGEDRTILSCLYGGSQERLPWMNGPEGGTPFRFQLPFPLAELLLPKLCGTERLQFRQAEDQVGTLLRWDEGAPWTLSLRVSRNEEKLACQLEGELTRGSDRLPLGETTLILPGGFVFTNETVARFRDAGVSEWITLLRRPEPLEIPAGEEMEFVDRLLDMPGLPRLELPEELQLQQESGAPVPHLVLHTPRGVRWQKERLQGEISFEYRGELIRGNSPQGALVLREQGIYVPRDPEQERQFWSQLEATGFKRPGETQKVGWDVEIQPKELGPAVRQLMQSGWVVRGEGKQIREPGVLEFEVHSHIDWFELHAKVDFAGHRVPFPELLAALARGDTMVRLEDGSLGLLPEEWFQQYGLMGNLGIAENDHLRFSRNQVGVLDALLATQTNVDFDLSFIELRERLQSFAGIKISEEPEGFHGKLRDYQREGVGWLQFLQEFQFGGCLADDMGLGKTVQLLGLLLERHRTRDDKKPSLVVVPKSLVFNWAQECTTFTPQLRIMEYTGLERAKLRKDFTKVDIILTTYGTLRRDILQLREVEFDYVVLDEAQAIKNARSQVAKASRLLRAEHRLALSGTPIENHLGDLWSIFEFLNPGMLGRAAIFKPDGDMDDQETRRLLSQALRPFILRRSKTQVANELPEKLEQTIHCKMGEQQTQLYNELRDHYRQSLMGMIQRDGLAKSKIHVLEALLRLRQAACHPALLDKGQEEESSAKLDVLLWHLEELLAEGHKVLVFSQFTSMLAIVRKHLEKKEIVYEYLDGQTRRRKEHVERFQTDPNCGVFLISLKAGGLGLNLTAADYVFILDPWWNPAVEAQAIDRAHRIGQVRQVFAYRLICQDTVEEKIAQLQEQKRDLAEAILQADNNLIRDLTAEDLALLFS
ncbi:MAG: DEAD/DEAH box helicase [Planctomycetales bacterium]